MLELICQNVTYDDTAIMCAVFLYREHFIYLKAMDCFLTDPVPLTFLRFSLKSWVLTSYTMYMHFSKNNMRDV